MLLISREDIQKVFTMRDAVEADKQAFLLSSRQKIEMPQRTNIQVEKHNGVLLFMPAYSEEMDCACIKVVNIYADNAKKNLPTSPSQVMLIDAVTGIVIAMLDGSYVTKLRTGAASGAAFDVLSRKDVRKGALIGTGGQGATQLEAMLTVRDLDEVCIYDRDQERLRLFVEEMRKSLSRFRTELLQAKTSDEAVEDADLIITVTPSTKPVFDGNRVKPGATVSCIGSYQPHMQEMPPELLKRASKLYFDSREAVLSEAGDILIPLSDGTIAEADFTGDLGDVLAGTVPGRENEEEIIVFKTVGIGAQDLVTSKAIYEKALAAHVGLNWA